MWRAERRFSREAGLPLVPKRGAGYAILDITQALSVTLAHDPGIRLSSLPLTVPMPSVLLSARSGGLRRRNSAERDR